MSEVAIIGAGELGGEIAHVLAKHDVVSTIRLIDANTRLAAGKALDIMEAAPIEQFAARVVAAADSSEAAGAAVVVVASELPENESIELLKRLWYSAGTAVIVCAAATHRVMVERGTRELRMPRAQVLGSAPEALAAALRAMVALELDGSPRDVAVTVLGVPPSQVVVPWEDATVGGLAATRVLDEPARRRLAARVAPLWPPGPYALANAAASAVRAIVGRSRRQMSAFVGPDDAMGRRHRAVALPIRLGAAGIIDTPAPALNAHDRVALDNAMML